MGVFDWLFGNKKEKERLERERIAEQTRIQKERERERRLAESRRLEKQRKDKALVERFCKDDYTLLVFHADWCGASRKFIKELNDSGLKYTSIDVEKEEELAEKYSVRSIPHTVLVNKTGEVIEKWIGYDDEDPGQTKLSSFIKNGKYGLFESQKMNDVAPNPSSQKQDNKPTELEFDTRTFFYNLEDIKLRKMGQDLMIAPYDAYWYFNLIDADTAMLTSMANTDRIRKYLSGLDFSTQEKTKKKLESFMFRAEKQLGVAYVIRFQNMPVGMIIVDTPLYNNTVGLKLPIFTIDFFILEMMEHKGIMYNSLVRVLNEVKNSMGAKKIYATVDASNTSCINLLGNGLFTKIDNSGFKNPNAGGAPPLLYMIDLEKIRFERR